MESWGRGHSRNKLVNICCFLFFFFLTHMTFMLWIEKHNINYKEVDWMVCGHKMELVGRSQFFVGFN
jgi:TRAP-type C4-dicarboxylate transport system permease small subunit